MSEVPLKDVRGCLAPSTGLCVGIETEVYQRRD